MIIINMWESEYADDLSAFSDDVSKAIRLKSRYSKEPALLTQWARYWFERLSADKSFMVLLAGR